jgi:hypothetical protein
MKRSIPNFFAAVVTFAAASFFLLTGPARAQVVIQDGLTSSAGCTDPAHCGAERAVGGAGTFGSSGWTVNTIEDQIRYDFGRAITCGTATFTVSGIDPFDQFVPSGTAPQYAEWAGLTERDTGSHWDIGATVILLLYTPCLGWDADLGEYTACDPNPDPLRYNVRLNTGLLNPDIGGCGDWSVNDRQIFQPDPAAYTFKIEWDQSGVDLYVNDALTISAAYPTYPSECEPDPKSPDIRYLFLGQTGSSLGHIVGPTYSNVLVESCDVAPEEGMEEVQEPVEQTEQVEESSPEARPDQNAEAMDTVTDAPADAAPDAGDGGDTGCSCGIVL